jgi:hypothetical protein
MPLDLYLNPQILVELNHPIPLVCLTAS